MIILEYLIKFVFAKNAYGRLILLVSSSFIFFSFLIFFLVFTFIFLIGFGASLYKREIKSLFKTRIKKV